MKEQCRSCGEWYDENKMYETDYRNDEMVCEGCYDNYYAKCQKCGELREEIHLINGICDPDIFESCTEAT